MGTGSIVAVADAGPLIHLHEIGCLRFLRLFARILVPDSGWGEATEEGRVLPDNLQSLGNVERRSVEQSAVAERVRSSVLDDLHPADRDCLHLCLATGTALLLTDDLALREAAQRLGIKPVGSLGVVVRAHREGLVPLRDAEALLWELHASSTLFVTPAIVELAIEQLRATVAMP